MFEALDFKVIDCLGMIVGYRNHFKQVTDRAILSSFATETKDPTSGTVLADVLRCTITLPVTGHKEDDELAEKVFAENGSNDKDFRQEEESIQRDELAGTDKLKGIEHGGRTNWYIMSYQVLDWKLDQAFDEADSVSRAVAYRRMCERLQLDILKRIEKASIKGVLISCTYPPYTCAWSTASRRKIRLNQGVGQSSWKPS